MAARTKHKRDRIIAPQQALEPGDLMHGASRENGLAPALSQ